MGKPYAMTLSRHLLASLLLLPASAFAAEPAKKEEPKKEYFKPAKSYGTTPETDPPRYVRTLSKTGIEAFKDLSWIDAGFELRERFEYRDGDLRRNRATLDTPLLQRMRLFLGVKEILDPIRFAFEFQDSRRYFSDFPMDDRDYNQLDILQGYGELHFKDSALGTAAPVRLRAGRMAFEVLDRRLIARNEWRNTTNAFEGVRALIGDAKGPWDLDAFALQPVRRNLRDGDEPIVRQWMFGSILSLRQWSDIATFQPFFLSLRQNERTAAQTRSIQSPGLRIFGTIPDSSWDFDLSGIYQFGSDAGRKHHAHGGDAELGYTFADDWKSRLSVNYGYATGDKSPADRTNQRFERFFGFARPWSNDDYMQWENVHAPKIRYEATVSKELRFDVGANAYWLDSRKDRWNVTGLRDQTGNSGSFLGHEYDGRLRYKLDPRADVILGYALFKPGEFTRKQGRPETTHFLYVELTLRAFE